MFVIPVQALQKCSDNVRRNAILTYNEYSFHKHNANVKAGEI